MSKTEGSGASAHYEFLEFLVKIGGWNRALLQKSMVMTKSKINY